LFDFEAVPPSERGQEFSDTTRAHVLVVVPDVLVELDVDLQSGPINSIRDRLDDRVFWVKVHERSAAGPSALNP
jgi:hypothetical protein